MPAMSIVETQDTLFSSQYLTPDLLRSEALPLGGNVFILKTTETPTTLLWRRRLKNG